MRKQSTIIVLIIILALAILAGCGGGDEEETPAAEAPAPAAAAQVVGNPADGEKVYNTVCVACHGPNAEGMPNLGKSMHPDDSEFIRVSTDEELVEFIKVGRTPDDPLNTTGVGMPAKGGNPAITDQQLYDVVAWMRTLD